MATSLTFDIYARDHASKTFDKLGRSVDQTHSRFSKMGKMGKAAGLAVAGGVVAGGAAMFTFLKGANAEAREAQKVGAQTNAVIKSTGGIAGVTAKHIEALSGSISKKVGVDDEAIQSGANLLLTFKNIRNEAGLGNKVFDRATKAAVDLSAAGFGDLSTTSKQLGKALNDPLKGITALGRAGVTFTQGQKDQIKALVESGNTLKAQKIILREVESQVGGSAAAQATAADRLRVSWGNFQESVGAKLLPILDSLSMWMVNTGIPAMERFGSAASAKLMPLFTRLGGFIQGSVIPAFDRFRSAFDRTGQGASRTGAALSQFKANFSSIFASVKSILASVSGFTQAFWAKYGDLIERFGVGALRNFVTQLRGIMNVVTGIFKTVAAILRGDWGKAWEGIKQIARGAGQIVIAAVRQLWNVVRTLFSAGGRAIGTLMRAAWNGVKSIVRSGANSVVDGVRAIPGRLLGLVGRFRNAGVSLIRGFVNGMRNASGIISGIAGNVWSAVRSLLNGAISRINSALEFSISLPGPDIHVNPPNIPHLARGGIVRARSGGTLVVAGEAGHDEAVVPLSGPYAPRVAAPSSGGVVGVLEVVHKTPDGKVIERQLVELKRNRGGRALGFS